MIKKGNEMKEKVNEELSRYKKELENKGYNVIYIGLYGSQNYNLDDELSDIDAKVIILPTLNDVIRRKVISKTVEFENGSVDIKDLLTFYDVVRKGNFSFIEAMQTKYWIGDKHIKKLFSNIPINQKSLLGAMYEKQKALTHQYPSKKEEFKTFGYDPKQLHHILRLYDIIHLKNDDVSFIEYTGEEISNLKFGYNAKEDLIHIKRNGWGGVDYVEKTAKECIEEVKKIIPNDYKYEYIDLESEVFDYIEKHLKIELETKHIKSNRRIKEYFTADTHFHHEKYKTDKNWEGEYWKKYHNIKEPFILYHLGDLSFKNSHEDIGEIIKKYKSNPNLVNMVLIKGNHDRRYRAYLRHGIIACNKMEIRYRKQDITLTHKPIQVESKINIHGHLHEQGRYEELPRNENNILVLAEQIIELEELIKL